MPLPTRTTPSSASPNTPNNPDWDGNFGESLGISTKIPEGNWGIATALGLPNAGCDFGACGAEPTDFTGNNPLYAGGPILIPPSWLFFFANLHLPYADPSDPNHRLFGTHYCGPGGGGTVTGPLDAACKTHDICYSNGGLQWYDNFNPANFFNGRGTAIQNCNQQLCNAATGIPGAASGTVKTYFQQTGFYACKPF